jgi:hypothetical protein
MTPYEFLQEEFDNVERALGETLRYDYGPEHSKPYYNECAARLARIKKAIPRIVNSDLQTIKVRLDELTSLATWISLIERSHLGEFSWPFAEQLREIANSLLAEKSLNRTKSSPIIHIVAEGEGYQIVYERSVSRSVSRGRRFAVIAFPRPLKHHVLLHTIFGHELGHTALHTTGPGGAGRILQSKVMSALQKTGPMASSGNVTAWLNDTAAPPEIRNELHNYLISAGQPYSFEEYYRKQWLDEFICDLFGLLLFGPGFVAAHETILKPTHPKPYNVGLFDPTHPPYAVRHKMLARAMQLLRWDRPVTSPKYRECHHAEKELLTRVLQDPYVSWATVFLDSQLEDAIRGIQRLFSVYGSLGYRPLDGESLAALVSRLTDRLPPILAKVGNSGKPKLTRIEMSQTLYAGWVYWIGQSHLVRQRPLSFFLTNRLCDQALLQQRAINIVASRTA